MALRFPNPTAANASVTGRLRQKSRRSALLLAFVFGHSMSTIAAPPSTRPAADSTDSAFQYTRPTKLPIEETTPKGPQLHWSQRRLPADVTKPTTAPSASAAPADFGPMKVTRLRFVDATGETVPVLLAVPASG